VDAVVHIDKNFSKVLHEIYEGNMSGLENITLMEILIFSKYPQVKAALAAKMKAAYDKFASVGDKNLVKYKDYSTYEQFSYFSSSLLASFLFTFYYTLLFLFKDYRGPFFWLYFRRRKHFVSMFMSHILFFFPLSLLISILISLLYSSASDFPETIIPLLLVTLGSVSLAFLISTLIKRESIVYYISPIVLLLGIIGSGVLGPERYMPIYLKVIYEAFPISIEFFYHSQYNILRSLGISILFLAYSMWYYLYRE